MTQWDFIWKVVHNAMPIDSLGTAIIIIAGIILSVWQMLPVPGHPWSWIARRIGRAINADMINEIGAIKSELRMIQERQDAQDRRDAERDAKKARSEILRFNDEILNGIRHSEKMFDNALDNITTYNRYCKEHPDFINDRTHEAESNIKKIYRTCADEHSFL
jgi:hypothetical protein